MNKKFHAIHCIDLNFLGKQGTIASYLIRHSHGAILIESGPDSTISALLSGITKIGLRLEDITDVFLSHIHLDHAGAAGWLSRQGIKIHVHPNGAPHLLEPGKLLASAERIYGDSMRPLWGDFLPVIPEQLVVVRDRESIEIGDLHIVALDTPGHADHHFVYILDDVCFSGDIGGIRLGQSSHIFLPTPPPEFNLEEWKRSIKIIAQTGVSKIAPTHFGIFGDAKTHLLAISRYLDDLDNWLKRVMIRSHKNDLSSEYSRWLHERYKDEKMDEQLISDYEIVNPAFMSLSGLQRYWKKFRQT
jgi:glyoxylase-like metal-dependent hydrolase (beta-lactamase superfamily II)